MQRPAPSLALPLRRVVPVCRRALRPLASADPAVSPSSGQPSSSPSGAYANGNGAASAPPTAAMGLVNTVNEVRLLRRAACSSRHTAQCTD